MAPTGSTGSRSTGSTGSPAGYSGTPLVKKLGIKGASTVALLGAPSTFAPTLTGLPADVRFTARAAGRPDLVIWFATSRRQLDDRVSDVARLIGPGAGLWIAWPKKASGVVTDLTEDVVRRAGLAHDLVDYKVCAIDATWSGLKFARRKR
jgi:hypothetical protein